MTYGLVANLTKKWVCVVFRGSVGVGDFWTDANFALDTKELVNEQGKYKDGEQPGTHMGFTSYLCQKHLGKDERYIDRIVSSLDFAFNPNEKNKDDDANVKPMITDEFKLYVTGHSLGGGLASLFAYHLAKLKERGDESAKHIPEKITAITFASPVIGNKAFQEHYHSLEEQDYLRHYRISNKGDLVSGLPPGLASLIPAERTRNCMEFVQNGLNFEFASTGFVRISDDTTPRSFMSQSHLLPWKNFAYHYVKEFKDRMKRVQTEFNSWAGDSEV